MTDAHSKTGWTRRCFIATGTLVLAGSPLVASAGDLAPAIAQPDAATAAAFIKRAFDMRDQAASNGDQSYGAIVVSPDRIIVGQAPSRVIEATDPTAHAEMEAIRDAARRLGTRNLAGHVLYSSSRPCPMCEAAAYWANVDRMVHGRDGRDAGAPRLCG